MEAIVNYFVAALKAVLAFFKVEVNADLEDNLRNMFGNILGYEPEVEA